MPVTEFGPVNSHVAASTSSRNKDIMTVQTEIIKSGNSPLMCAIYLQNT